MLPADLPCSSLKVIGATRGGQVEQDIGRVEQGTLNCRGKLKSLRIPYFNSATESMLTSAMLSIETGICDVYMIRRDVKNELGGPLAAL